MNQSTNEANKQRTEPEPIPGVEVQIEGVLVREVLRHLKDALIGLEYSWRQPRQERSVPVHARVVLAHVAAVVPRWGVSLVLFWEFM